MKHRHVISIGGTLHETDSPEAQNYIKSYNRITPESLETFLQQPGINIAGICSEAGIAQQYLNRCRKDKKLPGAAVLSKLLPIINKYGYKS